jgi:hypothetical protein
MKLCSMQNRSVHSRGKGPESRQKAAWRHTLYWPWCPCAVERRCNSCRPTFWNGSTRVTSEFGTVQVSSGCGGLSAWLVTLRTPEKLRELLQGSSSEGRRSQRVRYRGSGCVGILLPIVAVAVVCLGFLVTVALHAPCALVVGHRFLAGRLAPGGIYGVAAGTVDFYFVHYSATMHPLSSVRAG